MLSEQELHSIVGPEGWMLARFTDAVFTFLGHVKKTYDYFCQVFFVDEGVF